MSRNVTIADVIVREKGNHIEMHAPKPEAKLYRITVNGIDYYFVRETGEYDGWGRDVVDENDLPPEFRGEFGQDGE